MDDPNHEDDLNGPAMMGEPDSLMFQPIRDLNADIEKLLEHLPSKMSLLCTCIVSLKEVSHIMRKPVLSLRPIQSMQSDQRLCYSLLR